MIGKTIAWATRSVSAYARKKKKSSYEEEVEEKNEDLPQMDYDDSRFMPTG